MTRGRREGRNPMIRMLIWGGAMVALLAAPALGEGQSRLIQARARIDATNPERVRVEIDYLVEVVAAADVAGVEQAAVATDSIPLEGLSFRPAVVGPVTAVMDGEPAVVSVQVSGVGRLTGGVSLPLGMQGRVELRLAYDVTSAFEGEDPYRIRIPLVAVAWASAEALPGVFSAETLLASELEVFEAFPSGLIRAGEVGPVGRHTLDLPAVPALISMRATTGRIPFGGLVQILDGLVLVILVATAVLGFRYLRRSA